MKKPKVNPDFPRLPIIIYSIGLSLFLLALGVKGFSIIHESLSTESTYSFGVIVNDTTMIYRNGSPVGYWGMMFFMAIIAVTGIGLGIYIPIGVTIAYIKKLARQKKASVAHQP